MADDRDHAATTCPGSGQRWKVLWGKAPYCPACHLGPKSLGVVAPTVRGGKRPDETVPTHSGSRPEGGDSG